MDEALRTILLANAALAGLVTGVVWDVRPTRASFGPDDDKGVIVLTLISPGRSYDHEGWDGLDVSRVQLDVWARSASIARAITLAVPAAIEGEHEAEAWAIGPCFLETEEGAFAEDIGGTPVFRRTQDWMVTNRPAG